MNDTSATVIWKISWQCREINKWNPTNIRYFSVVISTHLWFSFTTHLSYFHLFIIIKKANSISAWINSFYSSISFSKQTRCFWLFKKICNCKIMHLRKIFYLHQIFFKKAKLILYLIVQGIILKYTTIVNWKIKKKWE